MREVDLLSLFFFFFFNLFVDTGRKKDSGKVDRFIRIFAFETAMQHPAK